MEQPIRNRQAVGSNPIPGFINIMSIALTIAGSDPTGGAGLQADLMVFRSFDVHGISVVTSITAQNTIGVSYVIPIEGNALEKQLRILLDDIKPDALKTGMLYSRENVRTVRLIIDEYKLKNLVIDPVSISSTGVNLCEDGVIDLIRELLLPVSRVITPNLYEAELLTGVRITDLETIKKALVRLKELGCDSPIITGGHFGEDESIDILYDREFHIFSGEKIKGEFHGTGCIFSSAITANLAKGMEIYESMKIAKSYINDAIKRARFFGKGMGILSI